MYEMIYGIAFFVLVPFLALVYEGLARKLNARLQNRIGPPLRQPFYDIIKLWKKKPLKSQNDPFFKSAPVFYFISTYALFLIVPFSLIAFDFDFIFLIYLTILGSAFYVLAGASSDNPFSIVGSMREMILMIVYEITLAIVIFNFMIKEGVISFSFFSSPLMFLVLPLSAMCLIIISFVELHITPFDTSEAGAEIMVGAETEYSGKALAFMELSKYLKRIFFAFLIPLLIFGRESFWMLFVFSIIFLFIFTVAQATTSRYRVDQAFNMYLIIMVLALIDFILISKGII